MRELLAVFLLVGCLGSAGAQDALTRSWDDFAGADAAKAYRALWHFVADPGAAVPFFAAHLQPAARPDLERLRRLVNDLQSDDFTERDIANKELEKLGDLAADVLAGTLRKPLALEAKRRIESLLDRLERPTAVPAELRVTRTVEALEVIGSPEALRLLRGYAKGAPSARLTRLAQAAEERLAKRLPMTARAPGDAKTDGDGEPLPFGAIARLGTMRYRISNGGYGGKVLFTPDSHGVAIWPPGPMRGPLRVFEVTSGKTLYTVPGTLGSAAHAVAFAPDGKTLAFAHQRDKLSELRVIDWPSGNLQQSHDLGKGGTVALALLAPTELALVRGDCSIQVWDLVGRREVRRVACPFTVKGPRQLSPDGKTLAAGEGRNQRRLYLWEWQTAKPVRTIVGPAGGFERVEFSPDGSMVCTYTQGDIVCLRLWEAATGKLRRRLLTDDGGGYIGGFAFSRDGKIVVAKDYAGTSIVLWDVATGRVMRRLAHYMSNGDVAFSPDGAYLAVPGRPGMRAESSRIHVWEAATGKLLGGDRGHDTDISQIAFAPRGDVLATAGGDRTVRLWEVRTGASRQVLRVDSEWVLAMAFAPDGKRLASVGHGSVWLWDVDSGRPVHRLVGHGRTGGLRALAFSADGRRLVSWGDDWYLRVFDVTTGKAIREHRPAPPGPNLQDDDDPLAAAQTRRLDIVGGRLLADGTRLLLPTSKGIYFFDTMTGNAQRMLERQVEPGRCLACAPDARSIACWRPFTGNVLLGRWEAIHIGTGKAQFGFPGYYPLPAWSADCRTIAAIADPGIVLWETASGRERLVVPITGTRVESVAVSYDGRYLAAGLADSTALVWDLARLALH